MTPKWIRVTKAQPCPVCHKPDWCGVAPDGSAAVCMRVESPRPTRNGGWLHPLAGRPPPPVPRRAPDPVAPRDLGTLWRNWQARTTPHQVGQFAVQLGVAADALRALGAAWAPAHDAWAFPMRNAAGAVVGIRLRADGGRKWAVRGGHEGLFIPDGPAGRLAAICEGPTDTAAALTLGIHAIGRPSCAGAVLETAAFVRAQRFARVVLVADRDRPGREGAARLAQAMPVPYALVVPPAKDLRAWVARGATRDAFDTLLRHAHWRMP